MPTTMYPTDGSYQPQIDPILSRSYLPQGVPFNPLQGNRAYYQGAGKNLENVFALTGRELSPYLGGGASMYTAPPAGGRLMETLSALQGFGGQSQLGSQGFGFEPSQALLEPRLTGMGSEDFLNLVLQEPGRINKLLDTLLGGYTQTGALYGSQLSAQAQAMLNRQARNAQARQILSQQPIFGSFLAGGGLTGQKTSPAV